jgi:transcriptional regulator GlxA family with amidase domain
VPFSTDLALLFHEAFNQHGGRQAMVDRLFEVLLVQILRQLMDAGHIRSGMLAGMSHPKLRRAIVAMHGCTSRAYLQSWRVGLAQQALRRGRSLKMIAVEVGYGSEAALSRAFKSHSGMTPGEWKRGLDIH